MEIQLGDLYLNKGGSVNPANFKDETFEYYSIPAYDSGKPEVIKGAEIGSSKKVFQPNDVILSRIVPHIRRCWIVGENQGIRQIGSGEWITFRSEDIEPSYLRHYLMSNDFNAKFLKTIKGVGGSLMRADPKQVAKFKFLLPPLPQQKKIAAILDAADGYRQKTKALITKYDELTQSLFLDMFGDVRTNQKQFTEEILNEACGYITDGAHRTPKLLDEGYPFMTVANMKEYGYDFTDCKRISKEDYLDLVKNNCQPQVNDILFSKDGTVGKVLRVRNHEDVVLLSSIAILRFREAYNPAYVEHYLKTDFFLFQATSRKSGSAIRRIVLKDLKKTKIALPSLELQNQFAERVQAIEEQKAKAQESLAKAEDLFNSLLQKAFKGEL